MQVSAKDISKKGNAVAFTAAGETITGCYRPKSNVWRIDIHREGVLTLSDERNRNFPTREMAAQYASTLADDAMTQRMAWWRAA